MFEFMSSLSESRLFPSVANYQPYDAEQLAQLGVMFVCTLYILYNNPKTRGVAIAYARKTMQYGVEFRRWHVGATDLYAVLHGLMADGIPLRNQYVSDRFKQSVPVGADIMIRWLREMVNDNIMGPTHRAMFSRLDYNMKVSDSSLRAIRRLVMDWVSLDRTERRLATTRLIQYYKNLAPKAELHAPLAGLASDLNLEIAGANNPDDGVPKPKGAGGFIASLGRN